MTVSQFWPWVLIILGLIGLVSGCAIQVSVDTLPEVLTSLAGQVLSGIILIGGILWHRLNVVISRLPVPEPALEPIPAQSSPHPPMGARADAYEHRHVSDCPRCQKRIELPNSTYCAALATAIVADSQGRNPCKGELFVDVED